MSSSNYGGYSSILSACLNIRKLFRTSIIFLFAIVLPINSYAICASEKELTALNSRALQSHLMVAALACGKSDSYNKFMKKFSKFNNANHRDLQNYFVKNYRNDSKKRLNNFITTIANQSSRHSLNVESEEFCKNAGLLFDKLMKGQDNDIIKTASQKQFSSIHGISLCKKK